MLQPLLTRFFTANGQARGNAFLYKLVELLRLAGQENGRLQLARYAYLLARLEPKRGSEAYPLYKSFSEKMYQWALDCAERDKLITAIYIFVYENREEDAE